MLAFVCRANISITNKYTHLKLYNVNMIKKSLNDAAKKKKKLKKQPLAAHTVLKKRRANLWQSLCCPPRNA